MCWVLLLIEPEPSVPSVVLHSHDKEYGNYAISGWILAIRLDMWIFLLEGLRFIVLIIWLVVNYLLQGISEAQGHICDALHAHVGWQLQVLVQLMSVPIPHALIVLKMKPLSKCTFRNHGSLKQQKTAVEVTKFVRSFNRLMVEAIATLNPILSTCLCCLQNIIKNTRERPKGLYVLGGLVLACLVEVFMAVGFHCVKP